MARREGWWFGRVAVAQARRISKSALTFADGLGSLHHQPLGVLLRNHQQHLSLHNRRRPCFHPNELSPASLTGAEVDITLALIYWRHSTLKTLGTFLDLMQKLSLLLDPCLLGRN